MKINPWDYSDLANEHWRNCPRYEDILEISDCGRLRSKDCLVYGNSYVQRKNQVVGSLTLNGQVYQLSGLHRYIAKAFIPNPLNKPYVNHIDGNLANNCVVNLEWATTTNSHSRFMLTEKQVEEIFSLYPKLSTKEIGERYSVTDRNIRKILTGRSWKHLNYKPVKLGKQGGRN